MKCTIVFLMLVSICVAHQTHGSTSGEHHQSNTEFYSEIENIVEEYPFQDQPHISPASSERDKWIASGNLAYYTMLHATKSIYLPITVRLIFVGFEGDGNQGINLDLANLESWFEHIDHTLHHTWVNLDKRDPHNTNHENGRVEYTINIEVAKVCPLVTTIIEDAVLQYIRPEDSDFYSTTATTGLEEGEQNPDFYVDAFSFSHVLGSLVAHLGIDRDAYTLFILNPKRPFVKGDSLYGYRAGFSNQEIDAIYRNATFKSILENLPKVKASVESKPKAGEGAKPANPPPSAGKKRTVQFSDFTTESEVWANSWLGRATGGLAVNPACDITDESETCVTEVWDSDVIEKIPIFDLATMLASHGTPWQSQYIRNVADQGGYEQCLVDGWISNERFAFLDLSAGPFEWGPIIGGEGVRSKDSVPRVPFRADWRDTSIPEEDEESPSLAADMERYRSELAMLEAYKTTYCLAPLDNDPEFTQSEQCQNTEQQMLIMQETIASLESQGRAVYKPTFLSGGEYEGVNATHAIDHFLSQLGATISSTVRSLFVPPSAALPSTSLIHKGEQTHQFTKRVAFHVFVISNHDQYKPRDEQNFNYAEFKNELMKFCLPNQDFTFTIKSIDMSTDPVLAAAFGASLHSVVVPGINVNRGVRTKVAEGTFEAAPQLYIDTAALQQQLLGIASADASKGKADSEASTHIPIFLFSVGGNLPVFVDKQYQSVALSNMIVGVQSNFKEWESQIECNSKPVYINLRNPLRSLLASTVQYLAGLVPNHITYSEAYQSGTQNWLWTGLGYSPLSILSSAGGPASSTIHFSQIHTDNAHRNFVVNSILKSQHKLNKGVEVLFKQRTTENNLPIMKVMHSSLILTNLSHYHAETHAAWLEVAASVATLDWNSALTHADKALKAASVFQERAGELADITGLTECAFITPNENIAKVETRWSLPAWALPVTIVMDVIIVLLWFVFRNRKSKLKVN